ncbi:hypothetical protein GE061_019239 [Apolygus lucorum]|uniref:Calponin-homology (CH) domain-containing protein n=1 Tax=Apolygus lucorum TaxID=248454 RepID=A0A8S9X7W6_APOLU|nr:hypothetical protein GE061_019239 [Apolygus lucorum]
MWRAGWACNAVENIRACLVALERLGVNLEGVSVKELREGSLKSVLALFFALSKYKQRLKLQAEANKAKKHDDMLSSGLSQLFPNHIPGKAQWSQLSM